MTQTSYPSDLFLQSIHDAINAQIKIEVDKAINDAHEEIKKKVPEIISSLSLRAIGALRVDRFAPEMVLVIKWDDVQNKDII
jgi:hypothetical protein